MSSRCSQRRLDHRYDSYLITCTSSRARWTDRAIRPTGWGARGRRRTGRGPSGLGGGWLGRVTQAFSLGWRVPPLQGGLVRGQGSGVRSQGSGGRCQRSGGGGQRSEGHWHWRASRQWQRGCRVLLVGCWLPSISLPRISSLARHRGRGRRVGRSVLQGGVPALSGVGSLELPSSFQVVVVEGSGTGERQVDGTRSKKPGRPLTSDRFY